MRTKSVEEFKDFVDKALDNWGQSDRHDIYSFTAELAELIRIFRPRHKYLSIALEGFQGTGKTTVSLLIAKQYYSLEGHGEEESWRMAFNAVRFDIEDFVNETTSLIEADIYPALRILDDFAFQGASKWRRSSEQNDLLEYMQTIRTAYTCLIYSYVDDSAARFFRINAKIKIVFNMISPDVSELIVYTRRRNIMGTYYKRVGVIKFNIAKFREENPIFVHLYETEYKKMRKEAIVKKGKKIIERRDRRTQLLLAMLIGYYASKHGLTVLDAARQLRETFNIAFENALITKMGRKARELLGIDIFAERGKNAV